MNRRLSLLGLILFISFANAWAHSNINTDRIRKSKLVTKVDTVNAPPVNTITIDRTNLKITPTVCGQNDGAITGLKITAGKNLKTLWVSDFDRSHTYVTLDLVNIPPGRYELTVADDYSSVIAGKFTVPAIGGIDLDTSKVVKINETCGQKNGSITGLHIRNETFNEVVSWTDSRGQQVANKLDAKGLTSGYYYLTIMYDNLSCPISYGPVRLQNTGGPILDESNAYVTLANCNCENASLTGIKVKGTGKITYEWLTTQGYTRSNDLDLFGAGCEAYVLKVSDESGCGPTYSNLYRLPRPATPAPKPQPDYSKMVITKGTCSGPASVTGMRWSAYSKCYWIDQSGKIVSNTFDLIDVPSGFYYFYIEDPCGNNFKIDFDLGPPQIRLSNYSAVVNNICGNNTTGGIKINTTADIKKIRWVDAAGQQVITRLF